jgi:hypothetical protein
LNINCVIWVASEIGGGGQCGNVNVGINVVTMIANAPNNVIAFKDNTTILIEGVGQAIANGGEDGRDSQWRAGGADGHGIIGGFRVEVPITMSIECLLFRVLRHVTETKFGRVLELSTARTGTGDAEFVEPVVAGW